MRPKYVGGNHCHELAAVLPVVHPILDIYHALCISIALCQHAIVNVGVKLTQSTLAASTLLLNSPCMLMEIHPYDKFALLGNGGAWCPSLRQDQCACYHCLFSKQMLCIQCRETAPQQTLQEGVSADHLIAVVGRPVMQHGLVYGVAGLVREDAGRQTGHQLLDPKLMGQSHHVVLHPDVLAPELNWFGHVGKQASNVCGQVDDVGWLDACMKSPHCRHSVDQRYWRCHILASHYIHDLHIA